MTNFEPGSARRPPDVLVILLALTVVFAALTWVVTPGRFTAVSDGEGRARSVAVESYVASPSGPEGVALFSSVDGEVGWLNAWFEGLVSGSRDGAAIGVIAFLLVLGGAFGIVLKTQVFDRAVLAFVAHTRAQPLLLFPSLFVLFSLGGAVFGMGEETIPLVLLLAPIAVRLGYDSLTVVLSTFVATQVGFSTSWMNPFSVVIAQGIAGLPALSGSGLRVALWAGFTALGAAFTWWWAARVRRNPTTSPVYASDGWFRQRAGDAAIDNARLARGDGWLLMIFALGIAWVIWGVTTRGYYIAELAAQFFAIGLAFGMVALITRRASLNELADAFRDGAATMLPVVLVVGLAKGLVLLLGGTDPGTDSVLNTLLYAAARQIEGLPASVAAGAMLGLQSLINFFVTSGSGQAALTMPILAPLGDLLGVSRQVTVLAFQLGDGITNLVIPTSAVLMGVLGAARIDWLVWARFIVRFVVVFFALALACVVGAALAGYA